MPALPDPTSVEALIFDAGGVLLFPDFLAGRQALRHLGCDPVEANWFRAHYATMVEFDSMVSPDWSTLRRCFATHVGVAERELDAAIPVIETLVVATPWTAVPGAREVLRALLDADYKLGVISNAFGTVEEELRDAGICSTLDGPLPRVETIVDSHLVGMEKPDPRIFRLALDSLGVAPERAVHVGDSVKCDVIGAVGAGLHAVHLDPIGACLGAHCHINSLGDLLHWLPKAPVR